MTEPDSIPTLRMKLKAVLEAEDLMEESHDYRALVRLFNSFPQSDLWSMPVEAIKETLDALLLVENRDHVRLFVSPDLLSRSVSLMVVLPRDRFNPTFRRRLQDYFVERFDGTSVDFQLTQGADGTARIHFRVWVEGPVADVPYDELQQTVVEYSRTWDDRMVDRLAKVADDPKPTARPLVTAPTRLLQDLHRPDDRRRGRLPVGCAGQIGGDVQRGDSERGSR